MATENVQLMRRLIDEVWTGRNLDLIAELVDPSYEGHDPLLGAQTRDSFRDGVRGYHAAFPDSKFEADQILAGASINYVVMRWTARGTNLGPLFGLPPTGKRIVVTGINVADFRNAKMIWQHSEWDTLGLFRQLGLEDLGALSARQPHPSEARL